MKLLQKIFKQAFWQLLGKGVSSISTLIILGMIARNYGHRGLGEFSLALTYLAIFYLLSDFGFNAHVLKKLSLNSNKEWNKLLGTRIIWSGTLVVLALVTLPFWPFSNPLFIKSILWGSLAIIASGIFVSTNLIFQSRLRYDLSVIASSLGNIINLAVTFYLVLFKYPVELMLLAHFLGWLVIAFFALLLVKKFQSLMPIFDLKYFLNLFAESWPIAATLSLNTVYFRADTFMIAYFKSVADVGTYNAAYAVFQSVLVLPTFIMNAYYPLMLNSLKGIRLLGLFLIGLSVTGTILTLFLAPLIIPILTGSGFGGSVQSLQTLSLGFPAYFLSSLLMWLMVSKNNYRKILVIYAVGLLINLLLNFIYIPKFSYIAASWTTVISEYIILLMQVIMLFK